MLHISIICHIFVVQKKIKTMKAQVGKYYFGRHYNAWGIWRYTMVSQNGTCAEHIKDVRTYDEAVNEMYRLNGWGVPKTIRRTF